MRSARTDEPETDGLRDRLALLAHDVRRRVLRRRRLIAFGCVALAVFAGLRAVAPPPVAAVPVLVAAHDLGSGRRIGPGDVTTVRLPPDAVPAHRVIDPVGRVVAAPMRSGEPVTDVRLVGAGLTTGRPDLATVPVRLPDAGMAGLLRVGDRIDLLAADPQGGDAEVVAAGSVVLALPGGGGEGDGVGAGGGDASGVLTGGSTSGRLVVLGVPATDVTAVSGASVTHFLTWDYSR